MANARYCPNQTRGNGNRAAIFGTGVGATAAGAGVGGIWGFAFAVVGAIILLFIYRLFTRKKA